MIVIFDSWFMNIVISKMIRLQDSLPIPSYNHKFIQKKQVLYKVVPLLFWFMDFTQKWLEEPKSSLDHHLRNQNLKQNQPQFCHKNRKPRLSIYCIYALYSYHETWTMLTIMTTTMTTCLLLVLCHKVMVWFVCWTCELFMYTKCYSCRYFMLVWLRSYKAISITVVREYFGCKIFRLLNFCVV